MPSVFLAPHNDDETLFGAFTLARDKPIVINILWCGHQRAHETLNALEILGCQGEQWRHADEADPDWSLIETRLRLLADNTDGTVYAPAPETVGGNQHHDALGRLAGKVFGRRVTYYATYTDKGKSDGTPVEMRPEWVGLKLRALACYPSQYEHPSHAPHFVRGLEEFYVA